MKGPEHAIELFHGYTYSGHPVACAAGLATLEIYKDEGLFDARARARAGYWRGRAARRCKGLPHVIDVRNIGLMGAVELEPLPGQPGKRGFEAMIACYEAGLMVRIAGDTFEFSPPLICERSHIDQIFETVSTVLRDRA